MAPHSKRLLGGIGAIVLTACALSAAHGFGAAPTPIASIHQVNRAIKGDRLVEPTPTGIKRKVPIEVIREVPPEPDPIKRQAMDGCEPLFSPVTMPSAAHLTGRCIG